jgi:hypothetical protein
MRSGAFSMVLASRYGRNDLYLKHIVVAVRQDFRAGGMVEVNSQPQRIAGAKKFENVRLFELDIERFMTAQFSHLKIFVF